MPKNTRPSKPHLTDRGQTRVSTSLPWGGTQEEFNNLIFETRNRRMVDLRDRESTQEAAQEASANEEAVRRNQVQFNERPPPNNPRSRRRRN